MKLELINFRKAYNGLLVLDIDNLVLDQQVYWLKGANGTGKSSLLKAIAGILHFDGDIILNNHYSVKREPISYRRLVNFAAAEPVFPEFLTGMELIRLFAEAKGAAAGMENMYIERMKMQSYIHQPVGTYSSGMIKKLSLVLAFLGDPALILLDEPLITLDTDALEVLADWINIRTKKDGLSFLLASHQQLSEGINPVFRELEILATKVKMAEV